MGWLRPLEGIDLRSRGAELTRAEKITKARDLSKTNSRRKVASLMGVSPSTIGLWIGPADRKGKRQ